MQQYWHFSDRWSAGVSVSRGNRAFGLVGRDGSGSMSEGSQSGTEMLSGAEESASEWGYVALAVEAREGRMGGMCIRVSLSVCGVFVSSCISQYGNCICQREIGIHGQIGSHLNPVVYGAVGNRMTLL